MVIDHAIRELHNAAEAIYSRPSIGDRDAELIFEDACTLLSVLCRSGGNHDEGLLDSASFVLLLLKERAERAKEAA